MKQLVLENVRSAHNVGSLFRTADGAGVECVHLVGYTPTPIDRFGRVQKEIEKTSLGATKAVAWEWHETIGPLLARARDEGRTIVAVEQAPESVPLAAFTVPESVLYLFGSEVEGLSEATLAQADTIVEIPMLGVKESLNVAVAAGIVLYHDLVSN